MKNRIPACKSALLDSIFFYKLDEKNNIYKISIYKKSYAGKQTEKQVQFL